MSEQQTEITESPTASQVAWGVAVRFIWFLVTAIVIGYILMLVWNGLTDVTTLPEIAFKEGVCAWVLLRIVGLGLHFK